MPIKEYKYCPYKDWECPCFNEETGHCDGDGWCIHDYDYLFNYDDDEEYNYYSCG